MPQSHYRGAPATRFERGIAVGKDEGGTCQNPADSFALHANATPVDNTQRGVTRGSGFNQIFLKDRHHIARWYRVEIEHVGDGNAKRLLVHKKSPGRVTRALVFLSYSRSLNESRDVLGHVLPNYLLHLVLNP